MANLLDNLLTRREVLTAGAASVSAYWFLPLVAPSNVYAQARGEPRGTARFTIFINLQGGQSHVDGWDLKEHEWTPEDFDIQEIAPGIKWPKGLYPRLGEQFDKFSLVRSTKAWDAVHARAQYTIQSGHPMNPALQREIPPLGTVVGYEYAAKRRDTDTLPPYIATNVITSQVGLLKSGFLPATFAPLHLDTSAGLEAFTMKDADRGEFMRRWDLLRTFDARLREDPALQAKAYRDFHNYYEGAVDMMSDSRAAELFALEEEERKRYGESHVGDGCIIARNLVEADAGTHFIFVNHYDWDHHGNIYDSERGVYATAKELDPALSSLLEDLAARKRADGTSLLDETLVVTMGEFGRTPGAPNGLKGRDHHQYAFTSLFAGGGVKGGQLIGRTDDEGFEILESGMPGKEALYMEDVTATIYSAMGIDWTKTIEGTPSGRRFYYIEPFATKQVVAIQEIAPLFG